MEELATTECQQEEPSTPNGRQADDPAETTRRLRRLGIYTPLSLREAIERDHRHRTELVEGLFRRQSVNLLVGDSGLGKTPLCVQVGCCVAAGVPLFGRRVEQGTVLYCDAESDREGFWQLLSVVSRYLGTSVQPESFTVWSPNWDDHVPTSPYTTVWEQIRDRVREVRPLLVVVDPLRAFWPEAEAKNEAAADAIGKFRRLTREVRCSWLVLHHVRKTNRNAPPPSLEDDPFLWLQEVAGARALVNQTDTRLGIIEGSGQSDLLLGGIVRGRGPIAPMHLARVHDDAGEPQGYSLLTGIALLNDKDRGVLGELPHRFRFCDVLRSLGKSASNAKRFLALARALGLVDVEPGGSGYVKVVDGSVE